MTELLVFITQFLTIFMLGVQSLMVRDHNYVGAILGSFIIGVCQFFIYGTVSTLQLGSSSWYFFIFAGPIAIASAMYTQPILLKLIQGVKWK